MKIQERYTPVVVGVNATVPLRGNSLGGFLCKTAGTITVLDHSGNTIINAHPVTAGVYYPLPFVLSTGFIGDSGLASFTAAGGASGTIGV